MKILVIGTGGREHALALALSRDPSRRPRCTPHPATPASPRSPRCTRSTRSTATPWPTLAEKLGADLVVDRAGGAAGRRGGRRRPRPRDQLLRPVRGRPRELEGSKAFAKDVMAAAGVPTAMAHVCTTPERGRRRRSTRSGRRTSSRTTASPPARASSSPTTATRRWPTRRQCDRVVDRGVPRRPRGLAVRDHRRHDRLPAPAGPGLQADLRRRRGPEHRRHGRLHAAARGRRTTWSPRSSSACCSRPSTRWPAAAPPSPACSTPASR